MSDSPVSHLVMGGSPWPATPKAQVLSSQGSPRSRREEREDIFKISKADLRFILVCHTVVTKAGNRFTTLEVSNEGQKYKKEFLVKSPQPSG